MRRTRPTSQLEDGNPLWDSPYLFPFPLTYPPLDSLLVLPPPSHLLQKNMGRHWMIGW